MKTSEDLVWGLEENFNGAELNMVIGDEGKTTMN